MAVGTRDPDTDPDTDSNPIQEDYDKKFNDMTSPENYNKEPEEPNLYDQERNPDKDYSGVDDSEERGIRKHGQGNRNNGHGGHGLYDPEGPQPTLPGRMAKILSKRRNRTIIGIGSALGAGGLIFSIFFGPGLFLVHLKEVVAGEYAEIQNSVTDKHGGRIYRRLFFFNDAGRFDGLKQGGLRRLLGENRATEKLVSDLRIRGYDIELNDVGRVTRFNAPDGSPINEANFETLWQRRDALRQVIDELYPEEANWLRSRRVGQLARRYRLVRHNWLDDNRLTRKIDDVELRFKQKLRETLFGDSTSGGITPDGKPIEEGDDGYADGEQSNNQIIAESDDLAEEADSYRRSLIEDPSDVGHKIDVSRVGLELAGAVTTGTLKGVLKGINIIGSLDTACGIKYYFNAVEGGARTLRQSQLMKFSSMILSAGDAQKAGVLGSSEISQLASYLQRPDSSGKVGVNSDAYSNIVSDPTRRVDDDLLNKYRVAGGWTGFLGEVNGVIDTQVGGGAICPIVTNFFVQIIGFAIGIVAAFGTAGSSLALTITTSVIASITLALVTQALKPMIIDLLAGTIITGDETGPEAMTAFVSGTGAMFATIGTSSGLTPLTQDQYEIVKSGIDGKNDSIQKGKSFLARIFDINDKHTLVRNLAVGIPNSRSVLFAQAKNYIASAFNPTSTIGDAAGALFAPQKTLALSDNGQCSLDRHINPPDGGARLAADFACNPLPGANPKWDELDPVDNISWMLGDRDFDGTFESPAYVDENAYPTDNSNGEVYAEYAEQCFNRNDVFMDGDGIPTRMCVEDGPDDLYVRFQYFRYVTTWGQAAQDSVNGDYPTTADDINAYFGELLGP